MRPPVIAFKPPEISKRLDDIRQLTCCLGLLQASLSLDDIQDPATRTWLDTVRGDEEEQERLKVLATHVIRGFKRDELKDAKAVTEIVYLAPVLDKDDFRYLLKELSSGVDQSLLLDVHQLEGLAQLLQGADRTYLNSNDLVAILKLLNARLNETWESAVDHLCYLTMTVSRVLDAMADVGVDGLDRETLHEPLSSYLSELKKSSDPFLVYQAAYAYQALLCVPDNESVWQEAWRRTRTILDGVSGLVSAVKSFDLSKVLNSLEDFQSGLVQFQRGVTGLIETAKDSYEALKDGYDEVVELAKSGQEFLACLKAGLSFDRKGAWYSALRAADTLIQGGKFAEFKTLVYRAPCRFDPAFQWGVSQRLGEIASNPKWDMGVRESAVQFLGEIYDNDREWGQQPSVKQWIINILMQLSSLADLQCMCWVSERLRCVSFVRFQSGLL